MASSSGPPGSRGLRGDRRNGCHGVALCPQRRHERIQLPVGPGHEDQRRATHCVTPGAVRRQAGPAVGDQFVGELRREPERLVHRPDAVGEPGAGSAGIHNAGEQPDGPIADRGKRTQGSTTSTATATQHFALCRHGQPGVGIIQLRDQVASRGVPGAHLDGQRTLAGGRWHGVGVEERGDAVAAIQPLQARDREDQRVHFAPVQPREPAVHVAVKRDDAQVRAHCEDEPRPARAVGADRARQSGGQRARRSRSVPARATRASRGSARRG